MNFKNFITQFTRYFVTGFSGMMIDIGTLFLLTNSFRLPATLSVIFNQIIVIAYLFFVYKYWAFNIQGRTGGQLCRFLIVMGLNYAIAVAWMFFWNHLFNFNYLAVRIINIALSTGWNFLLYKHWVYRPEKQSGLV